MKQQQIADVVAPVLERCGLELDAVEVVPAGKRSLVRIIVDGDGPAGRGPLLDDIADATREISAALDAAPLGDAPYTLEVSSRGTSRPLATPAHWRRNRGRLVKATLAEEAVTGRIRASDETGVTLDVDGAERRLEYAEISKAMIQVELNRPYDPDLDDVGSDDDEADEADDEEN